MNMLILEAAELGKRIDTSDRRVRHISRVLKKSQGDTLCAGIADCGSGLATIESDGPDGMVFSFVQNAHDNDAQAANTLALATLTVLLGFPRPIQANRILKDLCSLGVGTILLCGSELGEKSYMDSDFFRKKEFRSALIEGAEQAANPFLPTVETHWSLMRAVESLGSTDHPRWALDPYRCTQSFGSLGARIAPQGSHPVLAIGSERGWTVRELDQMEAHGFSFASMGTRILKSETACIAAVSLALAALGRL